MKYWVYINDKVDGPYESEKLVTVQGFTPDTLICSEEAVARGNQEWVKASTVFEFESEEDKKAALASAMEAQATVAMLAKLETLTEKISNLQTKLDNMETHIDKAFEESRNQQQIALNAVATQVAAAHTAALKAQQQAQATAAQQPSPAQQTAQAEEPKAEQTAAAEQTQAPAEETPVTEEKPAEENKEETAATEEVGEPTSAEEELVIRSALDSLYNAKLLEEEENDTNESTFQDLLTPQQAKELAAGADKKPEPAATVTPEPQPEPVVEQQAQPEQQPEQPAEADNEDHEALLNELTQSPSNSEDVLDQIIQEKQNENKNNTAALGAAALGAAAAAAGLAAMASGEENNTEEKQPEETPTAGMENFFAPKEDISIDLGQKPETFRIPVNKDNPEQTEEVLPAEAMPQDQAPSVPESALQESALPSDLPQVEMPSPEEVPAEEAQQPVDLPQINVPENLEEITPEEPEQQLADLPQINMMEPEAPQANQPVKPLAPEIPVSDLEASVHDEIAALGGNDENASEVEMSNENTLQELVPGAKIEKPSDGSIITEEDLRDAFTERSSMPENVDELFNPPAPDSEPTAETEPAAGTEEANSEQPEEAPKPEAFSATAFSTTTTEIPSDPNELKEVELKAGSTYLISNFVPPEQTDAVPGAAETRTQDIMVDDKTTEIQDILSSSDDSAEQPTEKKEEVQDLSESVASALDQTTKRGASFDIKTVPMVQDPAQSERLQIDGLDDVNAQHDIQSADVKSSNLTKVIISGLVSLVLIIIVYVLLAFTHLLPEKINMFSSKKAQPAPAAQQQPKQATAVLEEEVVTDNEPAPLQEEGALNSILAEVQQYTLANGYTLQAFIEAKHPAIAADMITWDISSAVEPDNYSVLVKIPPENPQSFKTSYRFNYNAAEKLLEPTISDAKNLLDSASGTAPAGL